MNFTLFENILKKHNVYYVADYLNLTESTIKRWIDKRNIPDAYYFALLKLTNKEIDYSKFTYKQKDQFYTPIDTAKYCFNTFKEILKIYDENERDIFYIEPSAGSGSFLKSFQLIELLH